MSDEEFLISATVLAEDHPDDELALRFLEACDSPDYTLTQCISLAGKLFVNYAA